ncbi:hypothetical protein KIN20_000361 [Parelaphostrongylus tenuis]|uniref:LisH domain-containing protein n=1 Tax=Parelaphostrongylus tenuis TaxID=148309 RepID=A0AAD5MB41_PARTN|nr:hypothetical protein KIN20_000361 [Parelaphostrongylus tenuis]
MEIENVEIVDRLIFGYLSRQQYHETLSAFCNEAPSLRSGRNRFQNGNEIFVQVNDQLHDKNLEQIVSTFSLVGRFDVTPELIDFGIRLRDITNEFSTMISMRGRMISDNQVKLYGQKAFAKSTQARQVSREPSESYRCVSYRCSEPCRSTINCESQNAKEADGAQRIHHTCVSGTSDVNGVQQVVNQEENHQSQSHTSCMVSVVPSYTSTQSVAQNSSAETAQELSSDGTASHQGVQLLTDEQSTISSEEHMLIDYNSIDVKVGTTSVTGSELDIATSHHIVTEVGEAEGTSQSQSTSSFPYESGAHKRKAAVPHRRDELVAHTAQSLIIPNGVLLDLDANRTADVTSETSLLSNIDDSALLCLDRLINGNLDEVFPFCEDNDAVSDFPENMCNQFASSHLNENELAQEVQEMLSEPPSPLDIEPCSSQSLVEVHASKRRSLDESEVVGNSYKPASLVSTNAGPDEFEVNTGCEHPGPLQEQLRRSSFDSGKDRDYERKVAERLREFNRRSPMRNNKAKKPAVDRTDIPDVVIHEARNVPRVSLPSGTGGRSSRGAIPCFSSLFDESHSAPSSRESSPHREKLSKKEEERRRREKEKEKARQRDKDRIKRQRRDRETYRGKERSRLMSPDGTSPERRTCHRDREEKKESREIERTRELGEERKVLDDAEKKRAEERSGKESSRKKKEEQLEAKRQAEQQRRAEAMRRREEEAKKKRQEKERYDEKKKDEEKYRIEDEKMQKKKEEEERKEDESRKVGEDRIGQVTNFTDDGHETVKSSDEVDRQSVNSAGDSSSSDTQTITRNQSDDEVASRRDFQSREHKERLSKVEVGKVREPLSRSVSGPLENEEDVASVENEERTRKLKDEVRPSRCVTDGKKAIPTPATVRRREEVKKITVKPLEPGMMMSDTGVLDRINKEMESLAPRNRNNSAHSPEESSSTTKNTQFPRGPKRETPIDYTQVLFSNPPVVKRVAPNVEKKKALVISSGLSTENHNHLVFSRAHSSRLGMFLEKLSDKHRRFIERENDRALASPSYEDCDRNGVRSPVSSSQYPRHQQQRLLPQKRPLPASSLESYLGSPPKSLSDNRNGEKTASRSSGKKCKIDLSKMPDIIEKLYSGNSD